MPKTHLLISALCCFFVTNAAIALDTCPTINLKAVCVNSKWQLTTSVHNDWRVTGETVTDHSCQVNSPEAQQTKWNYAFDSARPAGIFCHYDVIDNSNKKIGTIQVKSPHYFKTGANWEQISLGHWKCVAGQYECLLFRGR